MSQDNGEEFRKQTSHWMDPNTDSPPQDKRFPPSAPVASNSTLSVDKGKGREVAPSPEARGSTAQDAKGKAKEANPLFDLSNSEHSPADEEILSPGAAAQRRLAGIGSDMNGRTLGGSGASANGHF
jgi:hypothetical protein